MHSIAVRCGNTPVPVACGTTSGPDNAGLSNSQGRRHEFGRVSKAGRSAYQNRRKNVFVSAEKEGDPAHAAPLCRSPDYADRNFSQLVVRAFSRGSCQFESTIARGIVLATSQAFEEGQQSVPWLEEPGRLTALGGFRRW